MFFKNQIHTDEKTWSILQLVLDFANDTSGKPFPKNEWIQWVLSSIWIKTKEWQRFFFNNVLSPLAKTHKDINKNNIRLSGINWIVDNKFNIIDWMLDTTWWFRREANEYLLKEYWAKTILLKEWNDQSFIFEKILSKPTNIFKDYPVSKNIYEDYIEVVKDLKNI